MIRQKSKVWHFGYAGKRKRNIGKTDEAGMAFRKVDKRYIYDLFQFDFYFNV